jgi:hypothetical protein
LTYKYKEGDRIKILGPIKTRAKNPLFEGLKSSEKADSLPKVLLPGGKILINEYEDEDIPGAQGLGLHLANSTGMVVGVKTHMFTPSQLESLNAKRAKRKKLDKEEEEEWARDNPGKKFPNKPLDQADIKLREPQYAVVFDNGTARYISQSQLEREGDDSGTKAAQKRYNELMSEEKTSTSSTKPTLFEVFKITKDTTSTGPTLIKRGDLFSVLTMRIKSQKGIDDVIDYLTETLSKHSKVRGVIDNIENMSGGRKRMFFVTKEGDVQSFIITPKASPTEMFKEGADRKLHPIKGPRTIVLK